MYLEVGYHAAICCVCSARCAACLLCACCLQIQSLWLKEVESAVLCLQVHPDIARSKLKITDELLAQHRDSTGSVQWLSGSCRAPTRACCASQHCASSVLWRLHSVSSACGLPPASLSPTTEIDQDRTPHASAPVKAEHGST
jgi:hypothetical protein